MSGAEAADKQPSCGDTITADTTLDGDLIDCPNNGIVIGADNVTLDLNGHPVAGDGSRSRRAPEMDAATPGSSTSATTEFRLKHGSVRDFAFGPVSAAHATVA